MEKIVGSSPEGIAKAAETVSRGGLVAFPTETVYGLGADATNSSAVSRIFLVKGRPADHPLIVHLGEAGTLGEWSREVPLVAWRLAERFWPGPLTLILKRSRKILDIVSGGQDTVGLRVPRHPAAQALLETFGGALAAPSANRYGRVSPTTAEHVAAELGHGVDCILDGGACTVGIESTILDLSGKIPRILRPGSIGSDNLAEVLGERPASGQTTDSPRTSGGMPAHYAPKIPVLLMSMKELEEALEGFRLRGQKVAVLSRSRPSVEFGGYAWWPMPFEPEIYARVLYQRLHAVDASECVCALMESTPLTSAWEAIGDRLRRAASGSAGKAGSG